MFKLVFAKRNSPEEKKRLAKGLNVNSTIFPCELILKVLSM